MTPDQLGFSHTEPGFWRVHGTAVAHEGKALLILGASGMGKSTLAAGTIALGCTLVADDAVHVRLAPDGSAECSPPEPLPALLEMRGLGLLPLPLTAKARLVCCLQLLPSPPERFPPAAHVDFDHCNVPLYTARAHAGLAAQAFLLLRSGGHTQRA